MPVINPSAVAIIGMACRFPGSATVDEFWRNLRGGVESIRVFNDAELAGRGVDEQIRRNSAFVPANGVLDGIELFDAEFFGFTPRDAEITDPQHRLFLEVAWEALESAGYVPKAVPGRVGVFAGAGQSTYLVHHLLSRSDIVARVGEAELFLANSKDYLATRVAYKLDLRGPAINANTACSTGLANVHLACQSLLALECDVALAGGSSIQVPQDRGYLHDPSGILSPDGHCRAFDVRASGTVSGNGAGVVLLKRFDDAVAARDHIRSVILATAMNNDGALKAGFTAPSISGQAEVITQALALADVDADTIGYVEAHGTGTPVGDPIEITALTRAYRAHTARSGFCAIGSVKTNIGHLDEAAGIAGLIKTTLAIQQGEIPPSLHFEAPNPQLELTTSPFYVASRLAPWATDIGPRRAAVSSFGIGGTNVHAVLEEAPAVSSETSRRWHVIPVSARSVAALEATSTRLAHALDGPSCIPLADAAYTLAVGRRGFPHRRAVVAQDRDEAVRLLLQGSRDHVIAAHQEAGSRPVVFMFPGQGLQYAGMARGLYEAEPVFRAEFDACASTLERQLGEDVRPVVFGATEAADAKLRRMSWAQPILFAVKYALARLCLSWGVQPVAMIGHSSGEYVAACLADAVGLEDTLWLLGERGRLLDETAPGAMLTVALSEDAISGLMGAELSLAAVATPERCVVSGPVDAIESFRRGLMREGVECRLINVEVAMHSKELDPLLPRFQDLVTKISFNRPKIPLVSSLTGSWLADELLDPCYWTRHLRSTVRFSDGIGTLLREYPTACFLEVGPGRSLASSVLRHPARSATQTVVTTLRGSDECAEDEAVLLSAMGRLWAAGAQLDLARLYAQEARRRVPLPTYPFERKRYWIDPVQGDAKQPPSYAKRAHVGEWLYLPSWRRALAPRAPPAGLHRNYLLWTDRAGIAVRLAERLKARGHRATVLEADAQLGQEALSHFHDFVDLRACDRLAGCNGEETLLLELVELGRYLGTRLDPARLTIVSTGVHDITGTELTQPTKSVVLGAAQVIGQERPHVFCRSVDIVLGGDESSRESVLQQVVAEVTGEDDESIVAWRGQHRWSREFVPITRPALDGSPLRARGVYLITGGTGSVGITLAEYMARTVQARLVLTSRSGALDPHTLRRLQDAGAEVTLHRVDVADEEGMRELLDRTLARFGRLDGVVHAAGVTADDVVLRSLDDTDLKQVRALFRPKVTGTQVLERVLHGRDIDFCLLVSSNASTLGGLGMCAYSAASHVLDAFAASCRRAGKPWISSNWDGWPSTNGNLTSMRSSALERYTMTPSEAEAAFGQVIRTDAERVVVSSGDLRARLDRRVQGDRGKVQAVASETEPTHSPPERSGQSAPPRSEAERTVCGLFEELLGIRPIGPQHNFFDLGGDSLLGSRLIARLARHYRIDLSIRVLFTDPTVELLAARVEQALEFAAPSAPATVHEEEGVL